MSDPIVSAPLHRCPLTGPLPARTREHTVNATRPMDLAFGFQDARERRRPRAGQAGQPATVDPRRALLDLLASARDVLEWPALGQQIAAAACVGTGATRAWLFLWDRLHDELELLAETAAKSGERTAGIGRRVPIERWADARAVIETGTPRFAKSPSRVAFGTPALPPSVSAQALIPLLGGDGCEGVLAVARPGRSLVDAREADLLAAFGRQAGALLAGARAVERGKRQGEIQRALSRIGKAAISISDQPAVMREIARAAREVMGCGSCTVELWNREADEMETVARAVAPEQPELERPLGRYPLLGHRSVRFALEQQQPVRVHAGQVGLTAVELEWLASERAESLLLAPLVIGGDALGQIVFASDRPRTFDREAIAFAEEVAAQGALAVQHARYVDRTQRHADEQAAMLRVSKAVIAGQNLRDTLAQIGRVALGFAGVDGCRVLLWHIGSETFELAAEENNGDWQTFYEPGARYPVADWPSMLAVMTSGQPRAFLVSDPDVSVRERANHAADGVVSVVGVPIMAGDDCLGCLALHARRPRRFGPEAVRLAGELAAQAAYAIDRARLFGQLRARAETDGLTGLLNHRAAYETLDRVLADAREQESSVGVIVVDLDDFKLFNDTHGHLLGDRVLVEVSRALKGTVRPWDHVARYGGDEFLVILPGAAPELCESMAGRLVKRMSQTTVTVGSLTLPIRFSVGAASFPRDGNTRQALIAYADSSMYSAKELGGGQVGSIERGTRSLEVSALGALSGLVRAVDRKDRYTKEHSDLVAEFAVQCGRALRLGPEKLEALELAGQLHDVGKIAVPDSILRKPGHLTVEEEAMIRQHVVFSELMIKGVPHLDDVLAAVANHHERWDGNGYPLGKVGDEIPLLGRILALADALSAMTADRPYRKGRTLQQAVEELRAGAGRQFDPNLVGPFIAAVTTSTSLLREAARWQALEQAGPVMTGRLRRPRIATDRIASENDSGRDFSLDLPLT